MKMDQHRIFEPQSRLPVLPVRIAEDRIAIKYGGGRREQDPDTLIWNGLAIGFSISLSFWAGLYALIEWVV